MNTLLIANRGEIARRVMRTARLLGLRTVAVYTEPDRGAPHVLEADVAVPLSRGYLSSDEIVEAARRAGADAVHPGYGFLSENAAFAEASLAAGLRWIGPRPDTIRAMADKIEAKRLMAEAGVPVLPGGDPTDRSVLDRVGFPLLVKASAGGGGRGMRLVAEADELDDAIEAASREALSSFADGTVFVERWLTAPRHIEVQVMGDTHGTIVSLGDRECSIQRRHQKVIEEAPAPGVTDSTRQAMAEAAVAGARALGYVSAGTFEFLVDGDEFFFLEMNTRLQVEHPVTECVTGLDLVRLQLEVADGARLDAGGVAITGHALEGRLYAEDPSAGYLPSPGTIYRWRTGPTPGVRYDSGVEDGTDVPAAYDPLLAKVIVHAPSRGEASARLARALRELQVHGVRTNRDLLVGVLADEDWLAGRTTTDFLDRHPGLAAPERDLRLHAAAAALAGATARRRSAPALAFAPSGWRNLRSAGQHVVLEGGQGPVEVTYSFGPGPSVSVTVDGEPIDGRLLTSASDEVDWVVDGIRRRVAVHWVGDRVWINDAEGQSEWRELPRFAEHSGASASGGPTAPLPGTVVAVEVEAGQAVSAGQVLVVLEAMKMEHRIVAPADATVAEVRVIAGDTVDVGQVLVVLG